VARELGAKVAADRRRARRSSRHDRSADKIGGERLGNGLSLEQLVLCLQFKVEGLLLDQFSLGHLALLKLPLLAVQLLLKGLDLRLETGNLVVAVLVLLGEGLNLGFSLLQRCRKLACCFCGQQVHKQGSSPIEI